MSVSDDESSVDYSYLNVSDPDGNDVESTKGTNLSLSGLGDGEHTVDYTIVDQGGNEKTSSWTFEVDTTYDGDTSPSVNVEGENNGIVLYDEDTDIEVDFDSADSNGGEASCVVGGVTIDTESFSSASSGDNELVCNMGDDDDDYYDTTAEVVIEMEDEAGNSESHSYGDVTFDASDPTVSNLGSANDLSTFNSNFDVEFEAFDSATDIEEYEYYFNGNSDDATTNSYDSGEFTVDLEGSDLGSGEHNLHVRVKDEAGRWSSSEIFEFEYYPNKDPEVSLAVPDNVTVKAGESEEFDINVENTGEFLIETVNVEVKSDLLSENDTVEDMEPGESVTLNYEVETAEEDIGEYSIDVSTEGPSSSESFELWVKANDDQRQDIESRLSEYEQKLESLRANVSELENSVSEEQSTRLSSNMSGFESDVEAAREAVDSGKYYEAESALDDIDSDFSKAKTSYENVRDEYRSSQRLKMILGGFAVLIFGGIGAIFALNRENIIDVDEYIEKLKETAGDIDTDTDGEGINLDGLKQKVSGLLNTETEAEEFEWDGFRD